MITRARLADSGAVLLGVGVLLGLWWVGGVAGWASGFVITPPEVVQPVFGESSDVYARAAAATIGAAFRGMVIGSVLAFVAAIVATTVPPLRRTITRLAAVANAAPWIAVAPILLLVLGRDRGPTAVAAVAVFFFVFVSTSVGLGAAPGSVHDVATALGSSRWRRAWSVQLPAAWPSVVDGLQLAAPAALAGAVFGEWYGAERGLGVLLITAMQSGRPERLWAASVLVTLCGVLAFAVLAAARAIVARRVGASLAQGASTTVTGGPDRARWRDALSEMVTIGALVVAAVGAWWTWIEVGDISPLIVPRPSAVWADVAGAPGEYLAATGATLTTAAAALAIGSGLGLAMALLASRVPLLAGMTTPLVLMLAATPLVALFPLFARVLGYEPTTVRALAAVLVFYPVFVYARSGLASARDSALDVADALGASPGRRFRLVTAPEAVPHVASGFRLAAGSAIIAAVVGESLIGREGLGVEFTFAYSLLDMPRAFGSAIAIVVVSVGVFSLAGLVERAVHDRWA